MNGVSAAGRHGIAAARDTWFRTHPAATPMPGLRLICLPPAGAGIGTFHSWPRLVPPWLELDLVKLPGRDARRDEPLPADLPRLVKQIARQTAALVDQDDAPFALFGHSMGGLIAYETAVALEAAGARRPAIVIVSGILAPDDVVRQVRSGRDQDPVDIVRELGGAVSDILERPDLLALFAPAIVADMGMLYAYEPSHRVLSCPVTTFHSTTDPRTEFADVAAWAQWTRAAFEQRVLSGGHHYPSEQPERVVAVIADLVRDHARPR